MAAPFNLNSLILPRRPPRAPPANSVPASDLEVDIFYSIRHADGEQPTFYGRFAGRQTLADGTQTARFDNLFMPNEEIINANIYRTVVVDDWFFVPVNPTATEQREQSGGKKRRKTRKTRKSKNKKHRKSY
jgi:hypothetical protein